MIPWEHVNFNPYLGCFREEPICETDRSVQQNNKMTSIFFSYIKQKMDKDQ